MSKQPQQTKPLIRVEEAARLLDVHPVTLVRWARDGLIELVELPNKRHRITEAELARLMSGAMPEEKIE